MTLSAADRRARRNALLLATAHGILGSQLGIHIILGGLAGALLAEDPRYATLPISIMVMTTMAVTAPISLLMGRVGRRPGFLVGASAGAIGGSVSAHAIVSGSFPLLLLGSVFIGVYQATNGYFRFAAADIGSDSFRPKAISWVLAGGLAAAFLTAEVVQQTRDLMNPVPYAGTYLAFIAINIAGSLPVLFLDLPPPSRAQLTSGQPLSQVLRRFPVIVAMLCAMVSYAVMNLLMTSTPLAMVMVGCSPDQAADVVRWHIFSMYLPSFFMGHLIVRFGHIRVMGAGIMLLASAGFVAVTGPELIAFYVTLILLGLGWNCSFIGATSLLASNHSAGERARVQGLNDFLVFGLVAVASFSSGALLSTSGWIAVIYAMAPALLIGAVALFCLAWVTKERRWSKI